MQSDPRPIRGWALVLPILVTVLVGAGLGGFVVFENIRESERIGTADDIGAEYLSSVASFRLRVSKALDGADQDDPAALRAALEVAIAEPPVLGEADPTAAERSSTYTEARRVSETLLDPYVELDATLKHAIGARRFVDAARDVLQLRATDYVDGVLIDDSTQVRRSLIPAFVAGRNEFAAVPVPTGAEEAARLVRAALQEVIDKATALADSIDANRAYTFTYGESFRVAAVAVDDFVAQLDGDLTEALNAVHDLR
ncbi:MAG TPA: hypothetical protein VNZ66_00315 [Aeromicrobium sp.]|nr:hypothetical protein [Aeromicrobium sp.]